MNQADERAIVWEMEAFAEAWNSGNAWLAASFCTDDCIYVGALGGVQHGRAEIEWAFDRHFHDLFPGGRMKEEHGHVRELAPQAAEWEADLEIDEPNGTLMWSGHIVVGLRKVNGRWLISEMQPTMGKLPQVPRQQQAA